MQHALKDIFGPMLKGEVNHHLGYESNDKGEKETTIDRTGTEKRKSKRLLAKLILPYLVIVTVHLNQSSFPSVKEMFLPSRIKLSPCMQEECPSEIFHLLSKISMVSPCLMK